MNDPSCPQARFEAILSEMLDGSPSDPQRSELERLVLGNDSLKRTYVQAMSTHALLRWMHGAAPTAPAGRSDEPAVLSDDAVLSDESAVAAPPLAPSGTPIAPSFQNTSEPFIPSSPQSSSPPMGGGPAGAFFSYPVICGFILFVVIGSFAIYRGLGMDSHDQKSVALNTAPGDGEEPKVLSQNLQHPVSVAVLSALADCKWTEEQPALASGSRLNVGQSLHLTGGVAEITFGVGAKVIVQSPASFSIDSAKGIRLDHGKLTAEITRTTAHGFKVVTPDATFVDQGTEFGVEVAPSGGSSRVHVFKGEVDLALSNKNGAVLPTQRLLANSGARLEGDASHVTFVEETGESYLRSMDQTERDLHVMAYWRFEDHPVGTLLPHTKGNTLVTCATVDSSFNGNDLFTYSDVTQPEFSNEVAEAVIPQSNRPNRSCLDNTEYPRAASTRDLYTNSSFSHASPLDLQRVTPTQWTVEASIKLVELGRVQTFVGRDGAKAHEKVPPRLAFQITADGHVGLRFMDVDDRTHESVTDDFTVAPGQWYHVAAVVDGQQLRLYVNALDGRGYQLVALTDLPTSGSTALGSGGAIAEWTIGRGKARNGWPGEWFKGWIDEVRICDVALDPSAFLFAPPSAAGSSAAGQPGANFVKVKQQSAQTGSN